MHLSKSDPCPIGRRLLSVVVVASLARAQGVRIGVGTLTRPVPAAGAQTGVPPAGRATVPGPTVRLTLDEVVELALENNLDIAVKRLNPILGDIAIASAEAVYRPSLFSAFGRASQSNAPTSQLQLSQGGAGVNNDTLTYNAGLSQDLRWLGGSFWASLDNLRQSTNSNNAFYNPHYNSIWTFNYRQPLLRGFRIDHSRRQLQVAAITRDLTDVDLRATLTNIVSDVHNAYWTYATAIQGVEVARQSLALATQLVADNQTRVTFGTLAQSDVIQAQAEAATRRQALVAAESTRRTAEQALKQLIVSGTDDPHWGATIEAVDRPVFSPAAIDAGAAVRRALRERTDIAIAEKHLELNDVTLRYLRDQTLPQMDMQVTYGLQGVGGSRFTRLNSGVLGSRVTQTIPGGVADAFDSLFSADFPRWTVGINLSYPLGGSTQDAAVARARVQQRQVQAQVKQLKLQVAGEVTTAAIQVRNAEEAVEAAQASRALWEQQLDAEESKFAVGLSTNYFVVQAQRELANAQYDELRAILTYRRALVELDRLQQTTLRQANVTVIAPSPRGGEADR